jgi:taurine dioxygenase
MYNHIEVEPLTNACGAMVTGVDLHQPLDGAVKDELYQALVDNLVIFFRDQDLSPPELAALGQEFGPLEDEPFIPKRGDTPGVYGMKGASADRLTVQNLNWHIDHSYREIPTMGIILQAIDPPEYGGDTIFANMYLAFESLSEEMQNFVSRLTGIHDVLNYGLQSGLQSVKDVNAIDHLRVMRENFQIVEHPLVCTHPDTAQKFLYVNPAWTCGVKELEPKEANSLLAFLFDNIVQPKFQCLFQWEPGSIAFWDNRSALHSPVPDRYGKRIMQRVAIGTDWKPS